MDITISSIQISIYSMANYGWFTHCVCLSLVIASIHSQRPNLLLQHTLVRFNLYHRRPFRSVELMSVMALPMRSYSALFPGIISGSKTPSRYDVEWFVQWVLKRGKRSIMSSQIWNYIWLYHKRHIHFTHTHTHTHTSVFRFFGLSVFRSFMMLNYFSPMLV